MTSYSFRAFLIESSNRQAYDLCRSLACLRPAARRPVLLLGDAGSGKTHLLWAVLNHIRAATAEVGLAYVTPGSIPEPVRVLLADPAPLQELERALLLVDQLEGFVGDDAQVIEDITRLFLGQGHDVLLASALHPDRLDAMSAGFRDLLAGGAVAVIGPGEPGSPLETLRRRTHGEQKMATPQSAQDADTAAEWRQLYLESRDQVLALQAELASERATRDELEHALDAARNTPAPHSFGQADLDPSATARRVYPEMVIPREDSTDGQTPRPASSRRIMAAAGKGLAWLNEMRSTLDLLTAPGPSLVDQKPSSFQPPAEFAVRCACGNRSRVPGAALGKLGRCPHCGAISRITLENVSI